MVFATRITFVERNDFVKINWKLRLTNKTFYVTAVPALILIIQAVAAVFGYKIDLSDIGNKLIGVINAVFGLLVVLGISVDPTTHGISDSAQAMNYNEPRKEGEV